MRVLIVSEGKHELGADLESSSLIALVRRMLPVSCEFESMKVGNPSVKTHRPQGKSQAYEKRALAWVGFAKKCGFAALVLVIDQDGYADRENGIAAAQENGAIALPRAMGVAIKSFDAWMLADESALSTALDTTISRQRSPEQIRTPKEQCQQLCETHGLSCGLAELYFIIAQCIDLQILSDRCPRGFAPFRRRVESIAAR